MPNGWYPQDESELSGLIDSYPKLKPKRDIHGLIVPHAGYTYSGSIVGKAYSLLKDSNVKRAVILSPSHYFPLRGAVSHNQKIWTTPFGSITIAKNNFEKINISQEHAIDNQLPFLQKLGFKEMLPLLVGKISQNEAKEIAEKLSKLEGVFIISTDLSHFLPYEQAVKKDKETIKAINSLKSGGLAEDSACGIFPLLILIELCRLRGWKPHLIGYKNSGDVTGNKSRVVGYASFWF